MACHILSLEEEEPKEKEEDRENRLLEGERQGIGAGSFLSEIIMKLKLIN
jgi:hypothetical protein